MLTQVSKENKLCQLKNLFYKSISNESNYMTCCENTFHQLCDRGSITRFFYKKTKRRNLPRVNYKSHINELKLSMDNKDLPIISELIKNRKSNQNREVLVLEKGRHMYNKLAVNLNFSL